MTDFLFKLSFLRKKSYQILQKIKMTNIVKIALTIGGGVALTLLSFAGIAPAQAVTFRFDFDDDGSPTITRTVEGITMTVSDPFPSDAFAADSDGLCVLGLSPFCTLGIPSGGIRRFNLQFDTSVQLNSYQVGFNNSISRDEIITLTAGNSSSVETDFISGVTRDFTNQIIVEPDQIVSVVGRFGSRPLGALQWREINVTEVNLSATTPEPVSLVALLGVGALGVFISKQKY